MLPVPTTQWGFAMSKAATTESAVVEKKSGGVGMLPLIVIVFGGVLASGGISWFLVQQSAKAMIAKIQSAEDVPSDDAHAATEELAEPAEYHDMGTPFIIALSDEGKTRYLQVEMQLMTHQHNALAELEKHMPRIRNNLLMRLGQEKTETLRSREDKERVQAAVLEEVNAILAESGQQASVDAVLFTSFVTQ
jgi:flagellar protein FliL